MTVRYESWSWVWSGFEILTYSHPCTTLVTALAWHAKRLYFVHFQLIRLLLSFLLTVKEYPSWTNLRPPLFVVWNFAMLKSKSSRLMKSRIEQNVSQGLREFQSYKRIRFTKDWFYISSTLFSFWHSLINWGKCCFRVNKQLDVSMNCL